MEKLHNIVDLLVNSIIIMHFLLINCTRLVLRRYGGASGLLAGCWCSRLFRNRGNIRVIRVNYSANASFRDHPRTDASFSMNCPFPCDNRSTQPMCRYEDFVIDNCRLFRRSITTLILLHFIAQHVFLSIAFAF
jgi:hypothetical protein